MKKIKKLSVGDVVWMERFGELIEIAGFRENKNSQDQIAYFGSNNPDEVKENIARLSTAWIIFEYGVVVGKV